METAHIILAGVALAFILCGAWFGVMCVIAQTSGWRRLAQRFRAASPPEASAQPVETLYLGAASRYRRSIKLSADAIGFRLQPAWILRPHHASLFIPWNAIARRSYVEVAGVRALALVIGAESGSREAQLTFVDPWIIDLLTQAEPSLSD